MVTRVGIRDAWVSLLAHVSIQNGFRYITEYPEFHRYRSLPVPEKLPSLEEIPDLYESSLCSITKRDNGQFYTPRDVTDVMVSRCLQFPDGTWVDPCVGVGNLLLPLVAAHPDPEKFLLKVSAYDIDDTALLITRVLACLRFQNDCPDLFRTLSDQFHHCDFLKSEARYDYAILNPPYTPSPDGRLEYLFLSKVSEETRGFVGVVPQSFTHVREAYDLRKRLLYNSNGLTIYCFDNIPDTIFKGRKFGIRNTNKQNSVRAAIVTSRKDGPISRRITPMLRWNRSDRSEFLSGIDRFLTPSDMTPHLFPKVGAGTESLYEECKGMPTLSSYLTPSSDFPLHVPSTPRYFISATYRDLNRASQHVLFFRTESDRERAAVLLNSSFTYWWWRVTGGGMTLSRETLETLPVPSFDYPSSLIQLIRNSENENLVSKRNAGRWNENVKHEKSTVLEINRRVVPSYREVLETFHLNNYLGTVLDRPVR